MMGDYFEIAAKVYVFPDSKYRLETHDSNTFNLVIVKFKEWKELTSLPFFNKVTLKEEFLKFFIDGNKLMLETKFGNKHQWGKFDNAEGLVINAD